MGPPPPPAVEGKERVRTLLISTEGAIQTPSPSIIHKLPGACTPGPPQLVDLLPRGCPNEESWLPSCRPCEPPPFRWQAIRLPSDGQLLQITTTLFFPTRHSSYGRLLDDHDYGSWGNYNNPLYDDS